MDSLKTKVLVIVPSSKQAENVPRDLVYGCWCAGKRIGGISFPPLTSVLIATILRGAGIRSRFQGPCRRRQANGGPRFGRLTIMDFW